MNKTRQIEKILLETGRISNVDTLSGVYGFRTNRLGAFIHKLRNLHDIKTEVLYYENREYKDCIYIWRGYNKTNKDNLSRTK